MTPRQGSGVLLALLLAAGNVGADIPRPEGDRGLDRLAEPVELGPIDPRPPVRQAVSRDGAGRLPEGVIVETEVGRLDPLQRDLFLVSQTILDPERQLRGLQVHRPEGVGFDVRPLSVTQESVEIDGRQVPRWHYRWAVQALRAGEQVLAFSRIDFDLVGLAQSRFAWVPVARRLEVAPLPPHLPEYLPVTDSLRVQDQGVADLVAGEPGVWRLQVGARGLSAEALRRMLADQLVAPPGLRLEEPEVRKAVAANEGDGLVSVWEVRIPLLPGAEAGDVARREARLPALRLAYLRPGAAGDWPVKLAWTTVESRTVAWQAPLAERRLAALLSAWPWLVVALVAAGALWMGGGRLLRWRRARADWRAARRRLLAAEDPRHLRRELQARLAGLPEPIVPLQRSRLVAREAPEAFVEAVAALDRACFAAHRAPVPALDELRDRLSRTLPRRWFR
jgi:hypothetical protein